MISFKVGNILESNSDALINTVNTIGVMGKGIALGFKKTFPVVFEEYMKSVKDKSIDIGKVQLVSTGTIRPKYVINFPTKKHWRHPSKIEYIQDGMMSLVKVIKENDIKSVSVPPLGCGNGKLNWSDVKPIMLRYLNEIANDVDIVIYEPGYSDQKMIQKDHVSLTPPRAMLLHLLQEYQVLGYTINLLVVQKLAYFLQRLGEPLNLDFEKGFYGPYAHRLLHLLKHLNGYYVWFKEEENKPGSLVSIDKKHYPSVENFYKEKLSDEQKQRVEKVLKLIEGFESPYGLELLATVDFVIQKTGTTEYEKIKEEIHHWTTRKKNLMKPVHIKIATEQVLTIQ
jgi:O-acetyl-ADP-ribose deacetylase (regulator of RNase III)